jgi:hypothetical protein
MVDEIVLFLATRVFTKVFWMLVLTSFVGVLMFSMRSFFRNEMFLAAAAEAARNKPKLRW